MSPNFDWTIFSGNCQKLCSFVIFQTQDGTGLYIIQPIRVHFTFRTWSHLKIVVISGHYGHICTQNKFSFTQNRTKTKVLVIEKNEPIGWERMTSSAYVIFWQFRRWPRVEREKEISVLDFKVNLFLNWVDIFTFSEWGSRVGFYS